MSASLLDELAASRAPAIEPLTVGQFHSMIEHGILPEGAPIELIDGVLVRKDRSDSAGDPTMHGPRHALCLERCQRLRPRIEAEGRHLRTQLPVVLSEHHAPEPDVSIVRGTAEDYAERHPTAADALALIEISDSSLTFDRTTKCRVYASAGVPLYWVINVAAREIETYEAPLPDEGRYARSTIFRIGDSINLPLGDGRMIHVSVADLLP
jgi:Uma2 family endonuclease